MSVRIKICGITSLEDARMAIDAGVDALGFMFYEPSPRNLPLKAAAEITNQLPPFVTKVGVFVDASTEWINKAIAECGLDALQFHGHETPDFCSGFGVKTIKAFRMRDGKTVEELKRYNTSAWLLDSFHPEKPGGTGASFNWEWAVSAKQLGRPIILAGGLTPENVAEAVGKVLPYGVDVSSGVEVKPGRKGLKKISAFITAVRSAGG